MEANEVKNIENALEPRFWQARVKITQVLNYGLKGIGHIVYNIRSRRSYLIPKKNVSQNLTRRTLKRKRSW